MKRGRIELARACMFAGKTTWVQNKARWAIIGGFKVVFIIPAIDTRYSRGGLNVSHDGMKIGATRVETLVDYTLDSVEEDVDVICIDEAHFLPGLAAFCVREREKGKTIFVAGLSSDKNMAPWPNMQELERHANQVHVFEGVCLVCQAPALYSRDLTGNTGQVVDIGGDEKYASTCWTHFSSAIDPSVIVRRAEAVRQAKFLS